MVQQEKNKINSPFKQELITPCGMNCGICSAYLRDIRKCLGCRSRDMKCSIRRCEKLIENKFKYCYECDTFPCVRIKRLDKRYRTRYEMSMIENLEYIQQKGINKFIIHELSRWKCPKCGGVLCVHNKKCYTCGTQKGLPITGKIGRFARILEKDTTKDTAIKIMKDSGKYESYNKSEKAAWWKETMERLEKTIGRKKAIKIMEACGQKCCGVKNRKIAKQYFDKSKNLKEFIEKLNNELFSVADAHLEIKNNHTLTAKYSRCLCGQVNHIKTPFKNDIYCHCSAEWLKTFFESALEKPVNVEIIQTIINGADSCKFEIKI